MASSQDCPVAGGSFLLDLNPMGGMAISLPFFLGDDGWASATFLTKNRELSHSPRLIFLTKKPKDINHDLRLGNAVTTIIYNFPITGTALSFGKFPSTWGTKPYAIILSNIFS